MKMNRSEFIKYFRKNHYHLKKPFFKHDRIDIGSFKKGNRIVSTFTKNGSLSSLNMFYTDIDSISKQLIEKGYRENEPDSNAFTRYYIYKIFKKTNGYYIMMEIGVQTHYNRIMIKKNDD